MSEMKKLYFISRKLFSQSLGISGVMSCSSGGNIAWTESGWVEQSLIMMRGGQMLETFTTLTT